MAPAEPLVLSFSIVYVIEVRVSISISTTGVYTSGILLVGGSLLGFFAINSSLTILSGGLYSVGPLLTY